MYYYFCFIEFKKLDKKWRYMIEMVLRAGIPDDLGMPDDVGIPVGAFLAPPPAGGVCFESIYV